MPVAYNPTTVSRGLLLNADFANVKSFPLSQNLYTYSQDFSQASWIKDTNVNFTYNAATAPDGTTTATKMALQSTWAGQIPIYSYPSNLPAGAPFTSSIYFKAAEWTWAYLWCDSGAGNGLTLEINLTNGQSRITRSNGSTFITFTNTSVQNVGNGWYRAIISGVIGSVSGPMFRVYPSNVQWVSGNFGTPTPTGDNTSGILMWGAQFEQNSSVGDYVLTGASTSSRSTITDQVAGLSGSINNSTYYYYDSATKSLRLDRDATVVTGGFVQFIGTGSLTATNFLYNDHTMEIVGRINDYNASNINVNEGDNSLFNYQGYHSGFLYNAASGLRYSLWNGVGWNQLQYSTSPTVGTWFHAAVTRSGNIMTLYLNGIAQTTSNVSLASGNPGVTDNIKLGAGNPTTGPYANYCKANVSTARMYNVCLTANEILQNYNAFRGRYGI
jgi:hypothetical protein